MTETPEQRACRQRTPEEDQAVYIAQVRRVRLRRTYQLTRVVEGR